MSVWPTEPKAQPHDIHVSYIKYHWQTVFKKMDDNQRSWPLTHRPLPKQTNHTTIYEKKSMRQTVWNIINVKIIWHFWPCDLDHWPTDCKTKGVFYSCRRIFIWNSKFLCQIVIARYTAQAGTHYTLLCDLKLWLYDHKITRGLLLMKTDDS